MSVTGLTQAEAQARLHQVDDAMSQARQLVQSMQDRTAHMVGSSWQGTQASRFGQTMQQHTDDFTGIINRLDNIVQTGRHNINAFLNIENA
jgi:uncharacterized protein YukE